MLFLLRQDYINAAGSSPISIGIFELKGLRFLRARDLRGAVPDWLRVNTRGCLGFAPAQGSSVFVCSSCTFEMGSWVFPHVRTAEKRSFLHTSQLQLVSRTCTTLTHCGAQLVKVIDLPMQCSTLPGPKVIPHPHVCMERTLFGIQLWSLRNADPLFVRQQALLNLTNLQVAP